MASINVTDDSFKAEVLGATKPVLIDFWAEWCGPCKQMIPALEELAVEMEGEIIVAKVNIEENPDIALEQHVRGVPTLMIFKDGVAVASRSGAMTKSKMKEWLNEQT